jgi:hypothetical protein
MTQKDLQALKADIVALQQQLGTTAGIDVVNIKNVQEAKDAVRMLNRELVEMGSDLDYINKSFKDSLNELSKQNTYLTAAKGALRSISSLSLQVLQHRKGESILSVDQIKKLQHKGKLQFEELELATKRAGLDKATRAALKKDLELRGQFNDELKETLNIEKQVNREIGLAGVGLKGFADFMKQIGFADLSKPFSDAIEKTKDARRELKSNQNTIATLDKEIEKGNTRKLSEAQILLNLGGTDLKNKLLQKKALEEQNRELQGQTSKYRNILQEVGKQLTLTNLVDFAIGKVVQNFFTVNRASVEFQRLTGQNASAIGSLNTRFATTVDFLKTASELTQQIGFNAISIFGPDQLAALAEAKNLLGLSAQEAEGLALQSKLSGNTIDSFQDGLLAGAEATNKFRKSAVAPGIVLKDVLNTSKGISASLGNNPERLGKAATAARAFGMELKQVDSIASSLLNFESSIEAELEAQLLTGKNINLAKARELAMTNDLEGLSAELAKNGASAAEFANMNRFAQEALAKAVGMSRDELAKSVMLQDASKNLTDDQRAAVLGVTKEQLQQVDLQQRLNTTIDKMAQVLAGPLETLLGLVAGALEFKGIIAGLVGILTLYKTVQISILATQKIQAAYSAISAYNEQKKLLASGAYNTSLTARQVLLQKELAKTVGIAAAWAIANPVKAAIGLVAAAGVGALVYSQMKDGIVDPSKGPVLSGEFGTVQLDPKDRAMYGADGMIKVGTDLIQNSGPTVTPTVNLEPLLAELQAVKQLLSTIASKDGNVYLDTDLVGKAMVIGSTGI